MFKFCQMFKFPEITGFNPLSLIVGPVNATALQELRNEHH